MAKSGMRVRAYIMIGTPGERKATVALNIEAMTRLRKALTVVNLQPFIPLPGTPIWNDPSGHGIEILDRDVRKFNRYLDGPTGPRPTWSPINVNGLTHGELLVNISRMRRFVAENF